MDKDVQAIQPQSLTNVELANIADFFLHRDGSLPVVWQQEIVKRLSNLPIW